MSDINLIKPFTESWFRYSNSKRQFFLFIDPNFLHKLVIEISENRGALVFNLECGTLRSRNLFSIVCHIAIANFEVMTINGLGKCHIAIENFIMLNALSI